MNIKSTLFSFQNINYEAKMMVFSTIFISFNEGILFVDLPIYLAVVGYTPLIIGILFSISTFVGSFLVLFLAILSDLKGRKSFVIMGYSLITLSFIILFITNELIWLVIVSVIFGISLACLSSSFLAWFTEKTDENNRNYTFALLNFIEGLFSSIGMLLAGIPIFISQLFSFNMIYSYKITFLINSIISLPSLFIAFKIKEIYKVAKKVNLIPRKSFGFVMKLSILGLIGLGAGIMIQLFPLWFYLKFAINVDKLGPIFAISSLVTAIFSFFTPNMVKKLGTMNTIIFPQILSIIILLFIPLTSSYVLAGFLYIIRNVLMNMSNPIFNSFIMSIIPEEERARGSAVITLFDSIPRSIGPTIGGYFFNLGMLDFPFFITATLYTASILMFYFMFKSLMKEKISTNLINVK